MLGNVTFRVIHESDKPFVKELYADSRSWEMAHTVWTETERKTFLDQQFRAQEIGYQSTQIGAIYRIIQLDGADIGRLIVNRRDDFLHIVDIIIATAYQGRGIGEDILKSLINEAQGGKVPVTLSVEKQNPAMDLYLKLGFQKTGEFGHYYNMAWKPFLGSREI